MTDNLAEYSRECFEEERTSLIKRSVRDKEVCAVDRPHAVLLGGQSGAGKTTLHGIYDTKFNGNIIVINGDEYRSRHPHYRELDAKYGVDAVSYTATWAGKMTEALIDALSVMQYNLVIEGTLRTSAVPLKTATLLKRRGYGVSLALMAVKPEISLISCQIRYEQMRIAGTIPRATDPAHHNKIIQDIVSNLDVLEKSEMFDDIRLFSRTGACLFSRKGESAAGTGGHGGESAAGVGGYDGGSAAAHAEQSESERSASEALRAILFGEWTTEEKMHYEFLQKHLSDLKKKQ